MILKIRILELQIGILEERRSCYHFRWIVLYLKSNFYNMRFIDFMMFYTMANFKRQKGVESMDGKLIRANFVPGFTISLMVSIVIEIVCYLFFHIDIADSSNYFLKLVIGSLLCMIWIDYIYRKKKRYEYITSHQYKSFTLSITLGTFICFLILMASVIGNIGIPVAIHFLLTS